MLAEGELLLRAVNEDPELRTEELPGVRPCDGVEKGDELEPKLREELEPKLRED